MKPVLMTALLLLAACAGGGSGDTTTGPTAAAALRGTVFELDGQTQDRSGVRVQVVETGEVAVTGADGAFAFQDLPAGTVTLDFGGPLQSIAHEDSPEDESESEDENEMEDELEDEDEFEDEDGNPHVRGEDSHGDIEVRCSVEDGEVKELSVRDGDRLRSEARLERAAGSPDADVEGKVRVESRPDRERFQVEAERLDPGTVVDVYVDGTLVGTVAAGAGGEAELERSTNDGEALPLGATEVSELAGLSVEVRLAATGETLLSGEVPGLPSTVPGTNDPVAGGRARGRARLVAHVAGLEGDVEIRRRPEENRQRFTMEAEHLAPGTRVLFRIEDPNGAGTFVDLASRTADGEGEAEISTEDGLPMPLGVSDVSQLVGLEVRVVADDGSGQLLLSGAVPELVAD